MRRHRGALLQGWLGGGEAAAARLPTQLSTQLSPLVGDLARLDRYERRARTHRRNAIRALADVWSAPK